MLAAAEAGDLRYYINLLSDNDNKYYHSKYQMTRKTQRIMKKRFIRNSEVIRHCNEDLTAGGYLSFQYHHSKCAMKQHKNKWFPKGVLLGCKRVRFGLQKEPFYNAKGALLECKRTPFCDDMQHS